MPYTKNTDLPNTIRRLPDAAQTIYREEFNAAYEKYEGDKAKAIRLSWAVVKRSYEETNGKWMKKQTTGDN